MRDSLYLAGQHLRHHLVTSAVLVASVTLISYLPVALQIIVTSAEQHFRARADSTPLVVGPRGSSLELVLGSVYFDKPYTDVLRLAELRRINDQKLGQAIPLHVRFRSRDCQIVGTNENYLKLRQLRLTQGTLWNMPGECVVGAAAADRLQLQVGDKIPVSTPSAFTLNNPPLRLRVVGVFAPTETPDDQVLFVNLETTWIIEGLGHGHAQDAQHGSPQARLHTDITPDNVDSLHFHGSRERFPLTAIIVIPPDAKAETLLLGQYLSPDKTTHIVRPRAVMDGLLAKVLMVRSYMVALIAVVSLVTLLTIALVLVLSIRLRKAEIVTMFKLGCSRFTIASVLGSEIAILLTISFASACLLSLMTHAYGPALVRWLILAS